MRALTGAQRGAQAPTLERLKQAERAAWGAADARNPIIPGADAFAAQARQALTQEGFDPLTHPKVARALDILDERVAANPQQAWKEVNAFRRFINDHLVMSRDAGERRLGKILRRGLDDWVEQTNPVPEATAAREATRRVKKAEQLDGAAYKADLQASASGTGGNFENRMRAQIKRILESPKLRAGFSGDEIKEMEKAVRGTMTGNFLRWYARTFSPTTGALTGQLTALGQGGAAIGTGNPLFLAPVATGAVAKALVERNAARAANDVGAMVRAGGVMPEPRALSPATQAIIRALAAQGGEHPPLEVQIPLQSVSVP